MSQVRITLPRNGSGPRLIVTCGGQETSVTISEATDLHRKLGEALLVAASRYHDIDPRIETWQYTDDDISRAPGD